MTFDPNGPGGMKHVPFFREFSAAMGKSARGSIASREEGTPKREDDKDAELMAVLLGVVDPPSEARLTNLGPR